MGVAVNGWVVFDGVVGLQRATGTGIGRVIEQVWNGRIAVGGIDSGVGESYREQTRPLRTDIPPPREDAKLIVIGLVVCLSVSILGSQTANNRFRTQPGWVC